MAKDPVEQKVTGTLNCKSIHDFWGHSFHFLQVPPTLLLQSLTASGKLSFLPWFEVFGVRNPTNGLLFSRAELGS